MWLKGISLLSAILTGVFCAGFALFVNAITPMVSTYQVALLASISGFLGSLFAQIVLGRRT
ncbi:hypothetical protein [Aliiroseovarius sp. YM-037]|uniref:hypothetical protein n=1 Tax=Aliiroseovarius sp. YM-037 TaxID=3341728 RepID=UPI003A7FE1EC